MLQPKRYNQKKMELKVTILKHIKMMQGLIIITAFWIALIISCKIDDSNLLGMLSIPYLLLCLIPTLYLHLNYSAKSNNKSFKIENTGITKTENGNTVFYEESEFDEIVIYATPRKIKNYANGTIFQHYYYTEIKLKSKESLIITCLFSQNIDEILFSKFKNANIRKVEYYYPTI
jgi:hypothetical protein